MPKVVFWIDVDNTLLNNDYVKQTLNDALETEIGPALTRIFWDIYEKVRQERGVVDIPLTLTRFREQVPLSQVDELTYRHIHSIFDNYPFLDALYPQALETLAHLNTLGTTVIVSDGDLIYQAEKIVNSALAEAVQGRVLLYTHKQQHLDEIQRLYPGDHYVLIDDKPTILADTKQELGPKVTTVFVKQGKYAAQGLPEQFQPEITVEHIGDLLTFTKEQFLV